MSSRGLRHPALLFGALTALAAVVIVVLVIAIGGGGDGDDRPEYPYTVQTFEDQGREHLAEGQTYDFYNSEPPTSGPHAPAPAGWRVHTQPIPKEVLPHNMEHGGVVILYNCAIANIAPDPTSCDALRTQLAEIVESSLADGKPVLLAPYVNLEHPITLAAWQTLDGLDEFDGERIQLFIDAYAFKFNPEGFGPGNF